MEAKDKETETNWHALVLIYGSLQELRSSVRTKDLRSNGASLEGYVPEYKVANENENHEDDVIY